MRPHIYLKKRSDPAYSGFLVSDPRAINEVNANPFTESAGVGGPYSELAGWQEWAQEDWMAGINRLTTDELGAIYSSLTTSTPGQLTLPPALLASPAELGQPVYPYDLSGTWNIIWPTSTYPRRIAQFISPGAGVFTITAHAYIKFGYTLITEIYAAGAATPIAGALLASQQTDYARAEQGFHEPPEGDMYWHQMIDKTITVPEAGIWVVIGSNDGDNEYRGMYIPHTYSQPTSPPVQKWQINGTGAWTTSEDVDGAHRYPITINARSAATAVSQGPVAFYAQIGTNIWTLRGAVAAASTLAGAPPTWTEYTFPATVAAVVEFGGDTYVALGSAQDMVKITGVAGPAAGTALTGIRATKLFVTSGYLWRANGALLYYTGDGVDWVEIETPGRTIEAMAGMEGELYYTTAHGLYYVAPGDFIVEVTQWTTKTTTSAPYAMLGYDNALLIITAGQIYRMDSSRALAEIHPFKHTEAYQYKEQVPIAMATTQTRLFVMMQTQKSQVRNPSTNIMEWSPEGWHQVKRIAHIPGIANTGAMIYDAATMTLLFSIANANYKIAATANLSNPFINTERLTFENYAWIEYPRFYGNRFLIDKHFDQVSIKSELLGPAIISNTVYPDDKAKVRVYYRSEGVQDYVALGWIEDNDESLRWTGAELAGKWVQLAFLVHCPFNTITPRIKATILKYQSLLGNRARWSIPIEIDASQKVDGWTYSREGIVYDTITRLKELITADEPIIYKDIDGIEYEVAMQSYSKQLTKYDYNERTDEAVYNAIITVIIEQINPGEYV